MATKTKYYLDPEHAQVKGVLAGVADYTGWDLTVVRIVFLLLLIPTHLAALAAYFLVAWVAPTKPGGLYETPDDAKFWQGVRANPKRSAAEVRSSFRDLDRRLADLETLYTSRNTELAAEIDRLR